MNEELIREWVDQLKRRDDRLEKKLGNLSDKMDSWNEFRWKLIGASLGISAVVSLIGTGVLFYLQIKGLI